MSSVPWWACDCCGAGPCVQFPNQNKYYKHGAIDHAGGSTSSQFGTQVFPGRGTAGTGSGTSCFPGTGTTAEKPLCDFRECAAAMLLIDFEHEEEAKFFLGDGNYTAVDNGGVNIYRAKAESCSGGVYGGHLLALRTGDEKKLTRPGGAVAIEVLYYDEVLFCSPTGSSIGWLVPYQVTINGQTWVRKSATPKYHAGPPAHWGAFDNWVFRPRPKWKTPPRGKNAPCIRVGISTFTTSFAWPDGTPPAFTITTASHSDPTAHACDVCPAVDGTLCLQYEGGAVCIDGWNLGGSWSRTESNTVHTAGTGTDDPLNECHKHAVTGGGCITPAVVCRSAELNLRPIADVDSYDDVSGTGLVDNICDLGVLQLFAAADPDYFGTTNRVGDRWKMRCKANHDLRQPPVVADWVVNYVPNRFCRGNLTAFTEGDCADGNTPGIPPPPTNCPYFWCRYKWSGTHVAGHYNLDVSRCDAALNLACPDPPLVYEGDYIYLCCTVVTPPSLCIDSAECTGTCTWTWAAFPSLGWHSTTCAVDPHFGSCVCCGKPDSPGSFLGQTVAGRCCSIADGGCVTD